jgi:CBS domain-containing protein
MTIEKMARAEVVTVTPGTDAVEISRTLAAENVGSVVVVEDREPIGIVTDRDLALEVSNEQRDPAAVTAEEIMTPDLFTVGTDALIYDVLEGMQEAGVRRVPVVEGDELAGIVTLDDFLVLLASEFGHVSGVVQSGVPEY